MFNVVMPVGVAPSLATSSCSDPDQAVSIDRVPPLKLFAANALHGINKSTNSVKNDNVNIFFFMFCFLPTQIIIIII